ncbi:MAG: hypothetical protein KGR26_12560, partial [Cyanobacteria bacterium REEB65]|nr:hypothetical protein [Cyanobacteria bacterium REEB65]
MDGRVQVDAGATDMLARAVTDNAEALREGLRSPLAAFASNRLKQSAKNTASAFDRLSATLRII